MDPDIKDSRTQLVLKSLVDHYIHSSEPVGSRTLSKGLEIQVSPATIRNIMADLTEMGYLTQSHTSGGRIPTDKAYRFYVNSLAVANSLPDAIQDQLQNASRDNTFQVEDLLIKTTRTVAGLTEFICLVTAPKVDSSLLQRIEFIKINSRKVLVILITKSGMIHNKVIDVSDDLSQNFLNSISIFLNEQFHNYSLLEIRDRVLDSMMEDKDRYDTLLAQAIRLSKKAFDLDGIADVYVDGQMNLLMSPKFKDQQTVKNLLLAFDRKNRLVEVLDSTLEASGIQIFIGVENHYEELRECSLVVAKYASNNHVLGTIGVIGPTSMDYRRIIPVVDYTARVLSQVLTESTENQ